MSNESQKRIHTSEFDRSHIRLLRREMRKAGCATHKDGNRLGMRRRIKSMDSDSFGEAFKIAVDANHRKHGLGSESGQKTR